MDFFNVDSVETVKEKLKNNFKNFKFDFEEVLITDSLNRIVAVDIISEIDLPQFNRSTVDGYAVKSLNTHGANDSIPCILDLIGEVKIGEKTDIKIIDGTAAYVPTGGMIPDGADAVTMIEHVEKLDNINIAASKPVSEAENIIYRGDDIKSGSIAVKKGTLISPQIIGTLAAIGRQKIHVYKKAKFYIVSTGDEIIDIDEKIEIGKIWDINSYALGSCVEMVGGKVVGKIIVKDDYELLKNTVKKALDAADIVLISGGSSVGAYDFTNKVINSFEGKGVFVHGISIKPGKPTIIGEALSKPVFGMPGHPVSAVIVFKVFVEYLIKQILNTNEIKYPVKALIYSNIHSSPGKKTYQMVTLKNKNNKLYAEPVFGKSGMITLLAKSSGYIIIDEFTEGLNCEEEVDVYLI